MRRARATSSNSARCLRSGASARALPRPRKWNASRAKAACAERGSQALDAATHRRADATGTGWCRRAAGLTPHSRARIDGSQGVPARRYRLQKSASDAETQEKRGRWQRARERGSSPNGSERTRSSGRSSTAGGAVATPRRRFQAGAGRSRERRGAKVLARRKVPRVVLRRDTRSREPEGDDLGGPREARPRASAECVVREATGVPEARPTHIATGRKRPWRRPDEGRAARRSESHCREQAIPQCAQALSAGDAQGTSEARVLVRRREKAEVGPTHRGAPAIPDPQGEETPWHWPSETPHDALTR